MLHALHYNFVFSNIFIQHSYAFGSLSDPPFICYYNAQCIDCFLWICLHGGWAKETFISCYRHPVVIFFLSAWWRWFHRMELSQISNHLSNWSNPFGLVRIVCYNKRQMPLPPNYQVKMNTRWSFRKRKIHQIHGNKGICRSAFLTFPNLPFHECHVVIFGIHISTLW